jgi:cation:H+ antiporter
MQFAAHLLIYILAFVVIWLGSGLIVSAIGRFSKKLKLSSFAISFILLGNLTSIPEFAVGLSSIAENDAEIFIGNLLGGIPIIFLLLIPILAIAGNGINLKHDLDRYSMLATLAVIIAPSILLLNNRLSYAEGMILIILYLVLLLVIERRHGIFDKEGSHIMNMRAYSFKDIVKIFAGIGLVFVSSQVIVDKTVLFSNQLNIPEFYIGLVIISLGTNLPELSLAIRSAISGQKDIAFGDYMGSAAVNTLLFGVFTMLSRGEVLAVSDFSYTFVIIAVALSLFFIFSQSNGTISRREGFILISLYVGFVAFEFFKA